MAPLGGVTVLCLAAARCARVRESRVATSWSAPTLARVNEFIARARRLAGRIESGDSGPALAEELDLLRAQWRSLSGAERVEAAGAARALAQAQASGPRRATPLDDAAAARLALSGLDRIDVDAPPVRRYDGPRDPDSLLAHVGLDRFRPGQREVVAAALAGRDSLVVMPTGGGKSLCYQLPGIASDELTVVVSPLIALMADQYRRLVLGGRARRPPRPRDPAGQPRRPGTADQLHQARHRRTGRRARIRTAARAVLRRRERGDRRAQG